MKTKNSALRKLGPKDIGFFEHLALYSPDDGGPREECFITRQGTIYGNRYFTILLSNGDILSVPAFKVWRIEKPAARMFKCH